MQNNNKLVIIFSGYNQRAIISFIRTLEKNTVPYTIIARSKNDPILLSSYKKHVFIVRSAEELILDTIISYILSIKRTFKMEKYLVAPSTEALNRFLIRERNSFTQLGIEIPLVNNELYSSISDKKSFTEICKNNGILVPEEYSDISQAQLPLVAKPVCYQADNGTISSPEIIETVQDKQIFIATHELNDFYFQKLIQGKSFYLLYYFTKKGAVYKYSQENLIQQADGKSITAARTSTIHKRSEFDPYEKLFQRLGFFGLVMIEIISNETGLYMIEANPRFWGPSQLFVDAGMNFFEAFLHDYDFIDKPPIFTKANKHSLYFWFGGIKQTLAQDKLLKRYDGINSNKIDKLDEWLKCDIYNRDDTIKIFNEETK